MMYACMYVYKSKTEDFICFEQFSPQTFLINIMYLCTYMCNLTNLTRRV